MESCWEAGVKVRAYDPAAMGEAERIYGNRVDLKLCSSSHEALQGADALVIATEWREFRTPDFVAIRSELSEPVIIDGRNIYEPDKMAYLGFRYYSVGRPVTAG